MENSSSSSEQSIRNATPTAEGTQTVHQDPDISVNVDELGNFALGPAQTSTPRHHYVIVGGEKGYRVRSGNGDSANQLTVSTVVTTNETGDGAVLNGDGEDFVPYKIPILGYETLEEREKFTVFRLEVHKSSGESWFIFRRYSDFKRLKRQLKRIFPDVRLPLPPKKWFGDNFDTAFLSERMEGLQKFVDFVISNKEMNSSEPVSQFFCYGEPPGPYESLEESRALCESLEDQVHRLTIQVEERDEKIRKLEAELEVSNEKIALMSHSCTCDSRLRTPEMDSNENLKKHNSYS